VSGTLASARETSIVAVSAALYAVFFFLSYLVAVPTFTILYLPVILLGVFPVWFGLPGLIGSMIGAVIGGLFVENLGFLAWIELVTTLIIYSLNWILMPRNSGEVWKAKRNLTLLSVYALTLFLGTSYILWQFTAVGLFTPGVAAAFMLPTFALNYVIQAAVSPVLLRIISPRLKAWGIYAGTFWEWRQRRRKHKTNTTNFDASGSLSQMRKRICRLHLLSMAISNSRGVPRCLRF
jgi:hypothetical protein